MRDHYLREDENELPYLVSQKRDYEKSSECYDENDYDEVSPNLTNAEKLDHILDSMGLFLAQKVILKNALVSLLDSRDCTRLDVNNPEYGYYNFVFTRENEYIKTTDTFEYSTFCDEINVRVIFNVGSAQRSYDLDLERMELSDKYYEC